VLWACLACFAAAQHTSVEKNGAGRIETDYNAAGKTTEMRTVGPDNKLQQKVDYEYLPGYYGAQQTDTTYWPNGKVRKIVRHTYDPSTNFTGEFAQTFDDSGKQIGGHKLTHDPWTGIYLCSEWKAGARSYQRVACPSGEEESGGAKQPPHTFTYDEVIRNLEAARKAAQQQPTARLAQSTTPRGGPGVARPRDVGLVLPTHVGPGEQASGTIVDDPDYYEDVPEVMVTRITLPFATSEAAPQLSGWQLQIDGEKPQPADGPFTFVVPSHSSILHLVLRQPDNPDRSVSKTVTLRLSSSKTPSAPKSFQASPLCLKGQLCMVKGAFSGDSTKTFACFDHHPAGIFAETSDAAYLRVPDATAPGPRTIYLAEGSKVAALPIIVGELVIEGNGRDLKAGDTLIASTTLAGPSDLPETVWEGDNFPATSLEMARHFIPGFQLPKHHRASGNETAEDEEKGENGEGEVLLIVKNSAPQSSFLRASTNNMLIFHLGEQSFERGDFRYDALIQARSAGKVHLKGFVIPFLAPVAGEEFDQK
jgi:hypothetical protein